MNKDASNYIFSTEGHIFKLDNLYRGSENTIKNKISGDFKTIDSVTISQAHNMSQVSFFMKFSSRTRGHIKAMGKGGKILNIRETVVN